MNPATIFTVTLCSHIFHLRILRSKFRGLKPKPLVLSRCIPPLELSSDISSSQMFAFNVRRQNLLLMSCIHGFCCCKDQTSHTASLTLFYSLYVRFSSIVIVRPPIETCICLLLSLCVRMVFSFTDHVFRVGEITNVRRDNDSTDALCT